LVLKRDIVARNRKKVVQRKDKQSIQPGEESRKRCGGKIIVKTGIKRTKVKGNALQEKSPNEQTKATQKFRGLGTDYLREMVFYRRKDCILLLLSEITAGRDGAG